MLQIETYRGSVDELVEFVNFVWQHSYAGRMTFPQWTSDFFAWQFRVTDPVSSRSLIAAYDGEKLAGVLLGTEYPFRSSAGLHGGSQWSWLSIHPDYRCRGIAKALDRERISRLQQDQSRLIVSFRYIGSKQSQAERPQAGSADPKFNRKIGFWARVIDADRFSRWHRNGLERFLAKIAAPFCRIPRISETETSLRPYEANDLGDCLKATQASFASCKLSIEWDLGSLRHQLSGSAVCNTIVCESNGHVAAFVNYHILELHAKTAEKVALIDLIAVGKLSARDGTRLMNAALECMQHQGAILALKLRCGDAPAWPLLRTHFIPEKSDSLLVLQPVCDPVNVSKADSLHVLWR